MNDLLLISALAQLLAPRSHVLIGTNAPHHMAAALLAQRTSSRRMQVTVIGAGTRSFLTDDLDEIFHCAAQGRFDALVLGGLQIDGRANINLVGIGEHPRMRIRSSGSHGMPLLYLMIPNVVLFRLGHAPRTMVERVEFISAPGLSPPEVYRPGGASHLLTDMALFDFDRIRGRFVLRSVHPGYTADQVVSATGFRFDAPAEAPLTPLPRGEAAQILHDHVCEAMAGTYPAFAASLKKAAAHQLAADPAKTA
ncbi:CoA-transferase [Ramlibacter sp. AN1133]|uniref:CoA-transferase n=1 Tax=Ramlibacter sp. AN1133 TaxID=3133429 RepID=UPI0030C4F56E